MAPKNTVLKKAFVLSVVFQFSHRFSPKPPQFSGVFPSLRGTSASRLTVERCKAWIKSSPKTTLEVSPPGTQLEGVNHQTKPGEDLDQPWPNEKEDRCCEKFQKLRLELLEFVGKQKSFPFFSRFYHGSRCSRKGPLVPPTKPRSESPTFFFQEGEMKVASHFSGKARGKSSRSLAFHTHFTPKGIPGANGSWRNMRLAPFLTHLWRRGVSLPVRLASFRVFNYPTIRTGLLGFTLLGRHKRNAWNQQKKLSKLKWEKNSSSQQSDTSNLPDLEHSFYILPLLWLNWVENNANSNHLNHSPAWSPHDFPHLFWTRNNPESSIENDCFTVLRLFQILARCMILIVGFHSKIIFWYLTLVGYKVPGRFGVRPPLPQDQNHLKEIKDSLQKNGLVSIKSSLNWVLKLALLLYFFAVCLMMKIIHIIMWRL